MSRDLPAPDEATMTAFVVRRFQVLARPSLGNLNVEDLIDPKRWAAVFQSLRDDNADPFDLLSLNGAEPIDLACAQVVRKLSRSRRGAADALDVLVVLDPRRKAALFYALPERVRSAMEQHPSFGPVIAPYRDTLDAALLDLDALFASMVDGVRAAAETGDPERIARYLPTRFRSLIPADLRLREVPR